MKRYLTKILYILIIFLELLLLKEYNQKKNEEKKIKIEKNSISYTLSKANNYNFKDDVIKYEMILEIPIIDLKKGILEKDNIDNNIDKNVTILNESNYPDSEGNVFLAAHSGNGNKSYFNNLKNLKIKDKANLYYKNKKYIYSVNEIIEIDKKSNISLKLDSNNNLVLITCSQTNKSKYLVIILNKIKETEY